MWPVTDQMALGTTLAPALNDPAVRRKDERRSRAHHTARRARHADGGLGKIAERRSKLQALVTLIARWDEVPAGAIPAPDKPIPVTQESLALGLSYMPQTALAVTGRKARAASAPHRST